MRKNLIGSPNATILVKIQTSFDILSNIITPFLYFKVSEHFINIDLARMYCYLWKSTALVWYFIDSSLAIMILISLDRFICIVFPFRYKTVSKLKLYSIFFFTFLICILLPSTVYIKDILRNNLMIYNETTYKCNYLDFSIISLINIIATGILPL